VTSAMGAAGREWESAGGRDAAAPMEDETDSSIHPERPPGHERAFASGSASGREARFLNSTCRDMASGNMSSYVPLSLP
jgi:hypothetical protein